MYNMKRDKNGQFAQGNSGGPGRPRRAIEREYLAVVGDKVTLEDWGKVVSRALDDAKNGDPRARDWLAKYVIGAEPQSLRTLAVDELQGATPDVEIEELIAARKRHEDRWAARSRKPGE